MHFCGQLFLRRIYIRLPYEACQMASESPRICVWLPEEAWHIEEREAYMIWLSREAYQTRLSERYNLQDISHSLIIHTTESPTLYITVTWAPCQIRLCEPYRGLLDPLNRHISCHYMHCLSISGANDFFGGYLYMWQPGEAYLIHHWEPYTQH